MLSSTGVTMTDFNLLRTQFIQFLERIVEERGFTPLHGRILACLFLSSQARTQYTIAQWTGYSISAVSRALDQLVALGSIRRYKTPGERSYNYESGTSMPQLFIGAIEQWLAIVERVQQPISAMAQAAKQLDTSPLPATDAAEATLLTQQLHQLDRTLYQIKPFFRELVQKLRSLDSPHAQ